MNKDADVVSAPRDGQTLSCRNIVYGTILVLLGIGGLIAGVSSGIIVIGVIAFLVMVGLARFTELYSQRIGKEAEARSAIDMTAGILAAKLNALEPILDGAILGVAAENVVAGGLPEGALRDGRSARNDRAVAADVRRHDARILR